MIFGSQRTLGGATTPVTVDQVLAVLRRTRIHPATTEADLYDAISAELRAAGIPFERENKEAPATP